MATAAPTSTTGAGGPGRAVSGALCATYDLRDAVTSFLHDGPGKATYSGR